MKVLRSGELARRANVNVETLRFYERQGLLPAPPRRLSGYREFPVEAVARVRFIQRAQELGFSLGEIKGLLALREAPGARCRDVCRMAEQKVSQIDAKIRDLRAMRGALAKLLRECPGTLPIGQCRIIESLTRDPSNNGRIARTGKRRAIMTNGSRRGLTPVAMR